MKRFIRTIVILGLVALAQPAAAVEPRIALVIGNSAYKFAPPLANPANDARLMAETLRGLGFEVVERIDADRETILLATFELQDRLIAAGRDAVGLFFYAGHGVQVAGENYFIPLKAVIGQEREISVKAVSASFVLKQMEFAENRMNFVILDACRNNPFPSSTRASTRGLARMDAPTGSLVAYSTGPGEVAVDGVGDNSPYVLALTEAMQVPGLPAELMFKRVRERVLEATNDAQTPWEESSLKGGDFYFNNKTPATTAAVSDTPTGNDSAAVTQQETVFWQSIEDSADAASYQAYLSQYPDGAFAGLAKLRLSAAEAKREETDGAAEPETQTAILTPPPESSIATDKAAIDKNAIENDDQLELVIRKYFNRMKFTSRSGRPLRLVYVEDLSITSISGSTFIADIEYQWKQGPNRRMESATAKIEKTAGSYKIISFDRNL